MFLIAHGCFFLGFCLLHWWFSMGPTEKTYPNLVSSHHPLRHWNQPERYSPKEAYTPKKRTNVPCPLFKGTIFSIGNTYIWSNHHLYHFSLGYVSFQGGYDPTILAVRTRVHMTLRFFWVSIYVEFPECIPQGVPNFHVCWMAIESENNKQISEFFDTKTMADLASSSSVI